MSPANIIDTGNAEHYTWGENDKGEKCDGWHLVKTPELSIILERMPPGTSEVRHFHHTARQFFFVLEGEFLLEVDHEEFVLQPEHGMEVRPGQVHQAMNRSGADVRILVTSQPPSHGDRVGV
ncbi:MAG: cupin domain-containing protein [Acidobacteriaceae bacterium]